MAGKKQPAPRKPSSKGPRASSSTSSSKNQIQSPQTRPEKGGSEEDLKRQQTLLNIFGNTFRAVLEADDFASQLQEVKGALFNRDFEGAFAREAALDVYAARWSPTRALCYARVLRGLDAYLEALVDDSSVRGVRNPEEEETSTREAGDERERSRDEQDGNAIKEDTRNAESEGQEVAAAATTTEAEREDATAKDDESKTTPLKILAIGGAAAEIVAFADYISTTTTTTTTTTTSTPIRGEITLLDIGPWGSVTSRLHSALTTAPSMSRYASAAAKAANRSLISPSQLRCNFIQKDILSLSPAELASLIHAPDSNPNPNPDPGADPTTPDKTPFTKPTPVPVLITFLFTLNELYTAGGIKRTTAFLRALSSSAAGLAPGSLLLVVDSSGSYSEAAVGREGSEKKKKKRYPMQWLLEHTLIPPPSKRREPYEKGAENKSEEGEEQEEGEPEVGNEEDPREEEKRNDDEDAEKEGGKGGVIKWERIESHDSVWFRVAEGLRYPIPLENMRYQMHLYRACAG